jgi:hypothetical protein
MDPGFLIGDSTSTKRIRLFCRTHLQTQEDTRVGSAR